MKDPELTEAIEKCNSCNKCDSMIYDPSDYWEFICNSPEKAGIDVVEGVPVPHRKYCGSCRENDCHGDWFIPRSADKKSIEQLRKEYDSKKNKEVIISLLIGIPFAIWLVYLCTVNS